jgi:hypothetical protein
MNLDTWLADAQRDAATRGIPELAPLLGGLRVTLERLRAADWNDDLRGATGGEGGLHYRSDVARSVDAHPR